MSVACHFEFTPLQYVTITIFGLGYGARVTRCIMGSYGCTSYEVEYAVEGKIERREFYADEIEVTE